MSLDTVRSRWVEASYPNQPAARCGHTAVAVDNRAVWGEEFLVSTSACELKLVNLHNTTSRSLSTHTQKPGGMAHLRQALF
jgi:hypothetical protein